MLAQIYEKRSGDQETLTIRFGERMLPFVGYSLNSVTAVVKTIHEVDVSLNMIVGSAIIDGTDVIITIKDGENGMDYNLRLIATLVKAGDPNQIINATLYIIVRD